MFRHVIVLDVPAGQGHWSALDQLFNLQNLNVVGGFYQEGIVIYGILDLDAFPTLKTPDQWVELLKDRFSLVNPPRVSLFKNVVFITMPIFALKIAEVVKSFNQLIAEQPVHS